MRDQSDIPGTRNAIEILTTKFNVYFLLMMALCGGVLFIAGLVQGGAELLDAMPEAGAFTIVGAIGFCLFFPWFMVCYFVRHLLLSVKEMEAELEAMRCQQDNSPVSRSPLSEE